MQREDWIRLLLRTDASQVQSTDLLGIVADYVQSAHRFQQVDGGLAILDGGVTCTIPDPPIWGRCSSYRPISKENPEFSVILHEAICLNVLQTSWPVCVGVEKSLGKGSMMIYSDYDILVNNVTMDTMRSRHPWGKDTVVTVRYKAETDTIIFVVNGTPSVEIALPENTENALWMPTVGIRRGMWNSISFHPYANSISFLH